MCAVLGGGAARQNEAGAHPFRGEKVLADWHHPAHGSQGLFVDIEISEGGYFLIPCVRVAVGDVPDKLPARFVLLDPTREPAVPDVGHLESILVVGVAGVKDHIPGRRVEQLIHIGVIDVVFDEVVNHVQRESELGRFAGIFSHRFEGLCAISGEDLLTACDGTFTDVKTEVGGVIRQPELVAVPAPVLDHRPDPIFLYKSIQDFSFELGQLVIRAGPGGAARLVSLLPVIRRSGEGKRGDVFEFHVPDERTQLGYLFEEFFHAGIILLHPADIARTGIRARWREKAAAHCRSVSSK